ncbi:FAD-dependent monooxygenase [Colwellia maritima]|uniref:FAD-dependent monooxygenase n=1 Tax=Colwellia maritima TaxID=2912588 RepID=UPI00237C2354|nr:FAD-dependent monooxygenase [Colwellia maritima]
MKNQDNTFDIIISGGGLSGSLMALSLADLKKSDGSLLSIAIVETTATEVRKPKTSTATLDHNNTKTLFDNRVLALSHGSASYLKKLGVWQHLLNNACAIEKIDISDRGYYGKARIEAKEHGVLALGYVIEMAHIGQALLTALVHKSNVHWFSPDCIVDIDWQPPQQDVEQSNAFQTGINHNEMVAVTLGSKQSLYTPLLIACDGANSPCRQLVGIHCRQSEYQQMALIANVATRKSHNNKAFERFTEYGPLAMLPQSPLSGDANGDSRSSLVWTMSPEQSRTMMALNGNDFAEQLELAFGSGLVLLHRWVNVTRIP